jgi:hypothetical protein
MIDDFKSYHGSAFADLIDESISPIKLFRPDLKNNAYYILNDHIGLYVKHSTKRLTPWRFTFQTEHINNLQEMFSKHQYNFLVLVCGRDSIAVVEKAEIEKILPINNPEVSWVSVQRSHNTSLTVEGSSGALKRKIKKSKPFWRVYEILSSLP